MHTAQFGDWLRNSSEHNRARRRRNSGTGFEIPNNRILETRVGPIWNFVACPRIGQTSKPLFDPVFMSSSANVFAVPILL